MNDIYTYKLCNFNLLGWNSYSIVEFCSTSWECMFLYLNAFPSKHQVWNTLFFRRKKHSPYLVVVLDTRHFVRIVCRFVQVFSCYWSSSFHRLRRPLQGNRKGVLRTNVWSCLRSTAQNRPAQGRWSLGGREGSTSHGRVHIQQHRKTPRNTYPYHRYYSDN